MGARGSEIVAVLLLWWWHWCLGLLEEAVVVLAIYLFKTYFTDFNEVLHIKLCEW